MNRFYYYLFLYFLLLFRNTSFWFLYRVSDMLYLFLIHVFKYRKHVILANLRESFPEKSEEEIRQISRAFYKHLCDISVEGVKAFSLRKNDILKRYTLLNPEILEPYFKKKQSVIAVLGHYNNWEWGSLAAGIFFKHKPIAFYKPLSNIYIDNYIQKTRAKEGMILESVSHTSQTFRRMKKTPSIFIMVADQSPMNLKRAFWVPFLNHDTAVLHGTEKHAIQNNFPVFFADVQKVKRGHYTATIELLVENSAKTEPGEITLKFMQRLEKQIRAKPEFWLWSHRRWKHSKT